MNTKKIHKNLKNKKITSIGADHLNTMSLYELCRWAALKEAVDIVGDKCDERAMSIEELDMKPAALLKYVEDATDVLYNKILTTNEKV